jgi:hypothetical protein
MRADMLDQIGLGGLKRGKDFNFGADKRTSDANQQSRKRVCADDSARICVIDFIAWYLF